MYYFYMGSVLLPIAPDKFTLKVNNSNKTITLINEGEVNVLKEAGLTDLEFDALIPAVQYPFAKYDGGFKSPAHFTDHFEKLKLSKKPFQFIVSRKMPDGKLLFDTNMTVSLESYTIKEDAKQGFDLVVSFKLKQYKSFGTKIIKVSKPEKPADPPVVKVKTKRPESKNSPKPKPEAKKGTEYTVKSGDCLWNLARRFYGNGSKRNVIYKANKEVIEATAKKYGRSSSSNGWWIYPGTKIIIPSV